MTVAMVGMAVGAFFGAAVVSLAVRRSEKEPSLSSQSCMCADGTRCVAQPAVQVETEGAPESHPEKMAMAPSRKHSRSPSLTLLQDPLAFPGGEPALSVQEIKSRLAKALDAMTPQRADIHGVDCAQYPCLVYLELASDALETMGSGGFGAVEKVVGDGSTAGFGEPIVRAEQVPIESGDGVTLRYLVMIPIIEEGGIPISAESAREHVEPRIDEYFDSVPRAYRLEAGSDDAE